MGVIDGILVGVILFNGALFATLAGWALRAARRSDSPQFEQLSRLVAVGCGAVALGAVHRLGLQAHRLGWIRDDLGGTLLTDYQLVKSLLTAGLGILALLALKRLRTWVHDSDRVMTLLTGRAAGKLEFCLAEIDLTDRELEVLAVVGAGRIKDQEIGSALHISPHTARTHVRNIMRKTGVSDRRELILLAGLSEREVLRR